MFVDTWWWFRGIKVSVISGPPKHVQGLEAELVSLLPVGGVHLGGVYLGKIVLFSKLGLSRTVYLLLAQMFTFGLILLFL